MKGERAQGSDARVAIMVILAFLLLGTWLIRSTTANRAPYRPAYSSLTTDASGTRAAYELLQARGNEVSRHMLSEHEYPDGSCIVIADETSVSPFKAAFNTLEVKALQLHLMDGGSIVMFVDDDQMLMSELEDLLLARARELGLEDVRPATAAPAKRSGSGEPAGNGVWRGSMAGHRFELPQDRPPLLRDVASIEVATNYEVPIQGMQPLLSLEDPYATDPYEMFVGFVQLGQGRLVVVNRPEIISNGWIDRADNHRLVLALVEGAAQGAPILFDEHIHGFNEKRMTAGSLLTSSTGGQLTLLAVLFIIFLFLGQAVSPARFHTRRAPPRRQAAEMVLGQASLYQRAAADGATLRHIVDGVKHDLMRSHYFERLPRDHELQDWVREQMPAGWKPDPAFEQFLASGVFSSGRAALMRASANCDAIRRQIWGGRKR